jgi:hypothetical protein
MDVGEAINSMFRWYQNADKCYVYLSDVPVPRPYWNDQLSWDTSFRACRWFTRGWTLQELVAAKSVQFFSKEGTLVGDKQSLEQQIHEISGIALGALQGQSPSSFTIEERMSWARGRQTTRPEDEAYCLLGIFSVHMPLIYGEGTDNAFARLLELIEKTILSTFFLMLDLVDSLDGYVLSITPIQSL